MKIPGSVPWKAVGTSLGRGGQASVEVVVRRDSDSPQYALKALHNVKSRQALERFRREIETVKRLDHPGIIKIVDSSQPDDEFQYYVMEYHEGAKSLAQLIYSGERNNPFHANARDGLRLFRRIIEALHICDASSPRVVHRDINPKNILYLSNGAVVLIDFGICHVFDGQHITLTDEGVGSRNYTAPECESGNEGEVGVHSDLYSAGKVLWSAVTSRQAFAREEAVFNDLALSKLLPNNSDTWHLATIFEKTIRGNPEDRWRDGLDTMLPFLSELDRIIRSGYPPAEMIASRCPNCGWATVEDLPSDSDVFGASRMRIVSPGSPRGIQSYRCRSCGYMFVRDDRILEANVRGRQAAR